MISCFPSDRREREREVKCCDVSTEYHGARNCKELMDKGAVISDWYTIYPKGEKPMKVLCDMHTDGGGWIVIHRRWDNSVEFTRNWRAYKTGFGSHQEFWLGNEKIHNLTNTGKWELRIDLHDSEEVKHYAKYSSFKILAECEKYKLLLGAFTGGSAGDSLSQHHNMKFSTFDEDNDEKDDTHCASQYKGGWWFKSCHSAYLNGLYVKGDRREDFNGITWVTAKSKFYSFRRAEMKIRSSFWTERLGESWIF
ncbi:ficolin-1-like [Hyperolius riggenbachi]|uniref:ficolin-1-like n=1 Tax=Hyperolius riggenbachi TaxID=752182 RepID=UPI0035A34417